MLPTKAEVDVDAAAAAAVVAVACLAAMFPVAVVTVVATSAASCCGCCKYRSCRVRLQWLIQLLHQVTRLAKLTGANQ